MSNNQLSQILLLILCTLTHISTFNNPIHNQIGVRMLSPASTQIMSAVYAFFVFFNSHLQFSNQNASIRVQESLIYYIRLTADLLFLPL